MSRVTVHIDRLVVPTESFDVAAFTAALRRTVAASWHGEARSGGVAAVRVPPAPSASGGDVGAAIGWSVARRLR